MKTSEVMAIVGGHVNEELLKRNEYLAAENEILRSKIEGRIKFTDDDRRRLAKLALMPRPSRNSRLTVVPDPLGATRMTSMSLGGTTPVNCR